MFIMGVFFFSFLPFSLFWMQCIFFPWRTVCEIEQKKLISPAGLFKISTLSPKFLFLHVFPSLFWPRRTYLATSGWKNEMRSKDER